MLCLGLTFSVLVTTINDGVVTLVAAHNTNVSTFGPSIGLQNGTHHWVEAWDFQPRGPALPPIASEQRVSYR